MLMWGDKSCMVTLDASIGFWSYVLFFSILFKGQIMSDHDACAIVEHMCKSFKKNNTKNLKNATITA